MTGRLVAAAPRWWTVGSVLVVAALMLVVFLHDQRHSPLRALANSTIRAPDSVVVRAHGPVQWMFPIGWRSHQFVTNGERAGCARRSYLVMTADGLVRADVHAELGPNAVHWVAYETTTGWGAWPEKVCGRT